MTLIRIIAAFLCLTAALTGCSKGESSSTAQTDSKETASETAVEGSESDVLYKSELMTIKYTGETKDELYTYLNLEVTNHTDKQLMLGANNISADGVMLDPFLYSVCNANSVTETAMEFDNINLSHSGFTELGEVSFSFFITDGSSPNGLESSDMLTLKLRQVQPPSVPEGTVIFDSDNISVMYTEFYPSDLGTGYAMFYIENKAQHDVIIDIKDVQIDGEYFSAEMYDPINAGMKKLCYMDFWDDGVLTEDAETITFNLGVLNPETLEAYMETGIISADLTNQTE